MMFLMFQDSILLAYQIGFDLYESSTQQFLQRVQAALGVTSPTQSQLPSVSATPASCASLPESLDSDMQDGVALVHIAFVIDFCTVHGSTMKVIAMRMLYGYCIGFQLLFWTVYFLTVSFMQLVDVQCMYVIL